MAEDRDDCIQQNGNTAFCSVCAVSFPATNSKSVKQHVKSKPHKQNLKSSSVITPEKPARRPGGSLGDAEDLAAVCRFMGLAELPDDPGLHAKVLGLAENLAAYDQVFGIDRAAADCRPCLPPPVLPQPKKLFPGCEHPFLTTQCGSIPQVPQCMEQGLEYYFGGYSAESTHPKVDVEESTQCIESWKDARDVIRDADRRGARWWTTFFIEDMEHPVWWPKNAKGKGGVGEGAGSVPHFDQIILGSGNTGIGIHADQYGKSKVPVNTCLTMAVGQKHVIMLPPGHNFFVDGEDPFPTDPSPAMLHRIAAEGGYYFDLTPVEGQPVALFTPKGWYHWLAWPSSSLLLLSSSPPPSSSSFNGWHRKSHNWGPGQIQ